MKAMVFLGIALSVSAVHATERSLTLQDVTVLADGRGQTRWVFKMPEIAPGERIIVSDAQISFAMSGTPEERSLRLRVHPITQPWTQGAVTWMGGWSKPGGDFDEEVYLAADVDFRRGVATLDITGLVKEAVESARPTYGFLVTRDPDDGVGIAIEDTERLQALGTATVSVHYVRMGSPAPRQRE